MMAMRAWLRTPVSDSPQACMTARTSWSVRISGGRRRLGFRLATAIAICRLHIEQARDHSGTRLEYLDGGGWCKRTVGTLSQTLESVPKRIVAPEPDSG